MTALLLDTHAFAWVVTEPDRLSSVAREAVEDPTRPLLVSAATAWEMAIKHRAGRWPEVGLLLSRHDDAVGRLGALHLPMTADDAIRAGGLTWEHADPFDRMLAAQAMSSGAALVTRDRAFGELPGVTVLW
jgi:PIN domain nuclease of toxin-antitoxin system